MLISSLHHYPVKSMRGIALSDAHGRAYRMIGTCSDCNHVRGNHVDRYIGGGRCSISTT